VNGFTDVIFCPLLVNDLADILIRLAEMNLSGLYHTVSGEKISKYDFGVHLARQFGFDPELVKPVKVSEGGLLAARSPNLNLNTTKLAQALGVAIPGIQSGLEMFHELSDCHYPEMLHGFLPG